MDLKETISEYLKNTDNTVEYSNMLSDRVSDINNSFVEKFGEDGFPINNLTDIIKYLKNNDIFNFKPGEPVALPHATLLFNEGTPYRYSVSYYIRPFVIGDYYYINNVRTFARIKISGNKDIVENWEILYQYESESENNAFYQVFKRNNVIYSNMINNGVVKLKRFDIDTKTFVDIIDAGRSPIILKDYLLIRNINGPVSRFDFKTSTETPINITSVGSIDSRGTGGTYNAYTNKYYYKVYGKEKYFIVDPVTDSVNEINVNKDEFLYNISGENIRFNIISNKLKIMNENGDILGQVTGLGETFEITSSYEGNDFIIFNLRDGYNTSVYMFDKSSMKLIRTHFHSSPYSSNYKSPKTLIYGDENLCTIADNKSMHISTSSYNSDTGYAMPLFMIKTKNKEV